ncbi:MAG: hypothetical protein JXR89_02945 [Deltaproteobacteria bacterium]|nr:hypothetical protein [Deltaproteobacteria bacterium]
MRKTKLTTALLIALWLVSAAVALAHTPLCSCWDNGDGTVTCEGGFSDGSSAAGVRMIIRQNGKEVLVGQMDASSQFTFKKPEGDYEVEFSAGEGHQVRIEGKKIY